MDLQISLESLHVRDRARERADNNRYIGLDFPIRVLGQTSDCQPGQRVDRVDDDAELAVRCAQHDGAGAATDGLPKRVAEGRAEELHEVGYVCGAEAGGGDGLLLLLSEGFIFGGLEVFLCKGA